MKANSLFSVLDRRRIADAIAVAEAKTSAEIIPVVAAASGRYDRAEDIFGFLLAILAWALTAWLTPAVSLNPGEWNSGGRFEFGLVLQILIGIIAFVIGIALASRFWSLRAPFASRREMEQEVETRAAEAFQRFRLRSTAAATGVLIYVSLFERRVRVLGDSAIAEKLKDRDWEGICDAATEGIGRGAPSDGLVRAIELAGELLAHHFPHGAGDANELMNELVVVD